MRNYFSRNLFTLIQFIILLSSCAKNSTSVRNLRRKHLRSYRTNDFLLSGGFDFQDLKSDIKSYVQPRGNRLGESTLETIGRDVDSLFHTGSQKSKTFSSKKGLAYYERDGSLLKQVNIKWYYNWNPHPTDWADSSIEFVHMVWGKDSPAPDKASIILGFNEPDFTQQSDMTPAQALEYWPKVLSSGAQLVGSPSPALIENNWLKTFLSGAENLGYKVDFICLHRYSMPDPAWFLSFVDRVYALYQRPIWVTEFAVADWFATTSTRSTRFTEDEVIKFMSVVTMEFEKRPYIQRYSWFAADWNDNQLWFSAIFYPNGTLTRLGELYASI